jgi:tRNA(Arg) A34 adenosine deaminase TadA
MKVNKYFRMAAIIAQQGDAKNAQRRYPMGAVGIRNDGVVVGASNLCCTYKCPEAHAEYRTTKMLTPNSTVFVIRLNKAGDWMLAKPCNSCRRFMKNKGVIKVYYTISNGEYGVMVL